MDNIIQKDQLEKIRHFLSLEYFDSVVKESCSLLEEILKKIYKKALAEFSIEDRSLLLECEAQIGNKNKGYNKFGFGELVGLFNKSKLLDRLEKSSHQNLGIIRSISLEYIVGLRNQLTHNPSSANICNKNEAHVVYDCLTNWLSFIGYSEMDSGIHKAVTNKFDDIKDESQENYHKNYLESKTTSSYSSSTLTEQKRLQVQSKYSEKNDYDAFMHAFINMEKKQNFSGLDIGCANGSTTKVKFKKEFGFSKVIGIDLNSTSIANAKQFADNVFSFYQVNVENDDFLNKMEEIKLQENIDGFDIIYIGFTIHHLNEPIRFLRKVRKVLNPGGAIIITGVDDGAELAYGDDNLVEEIVELSIKTKKMSDRFHGRKFFSYLINSGFSDINMFYGVQDTIDKTPEEKDFLFQYYFSFRKDYTMRQLNEEPNNAIYIKHHNKMKELLLELEDRFLRTDFYYLVMTLTAVGFKK